jgi:hypothetical protein
VSDAYLNLNPDFNSFLTTIFYLCSRFVVKESGLAEEFIYAHPVTCKETLHFLRSKWGSIDKYLDFIGFTQEWRHALCEKLSLFKERHIDPSTCSHFSN